MKSQFNLCYSILLIFLFQLNGSAQSKNEISADTRFHQARLEAFDGELEKAQQQLLSIIKEAPGHIDAKVLLARTYAWQAKYQESSLVINEALEEWPQYFDALSAAVDINIWSQNYEGALQRSDQALDNQPGNREISLKKATALSALDRKPEALKIANSLLDGDPGNTKITAFKRSLIRDIREYQIRVSTGVDAFSQYFGLAHYSETELNGPTALGKGAIRVNYASRFDQQGLQGELDLYPQLTKRLSGYVNYGYSNSLLFPAHRIGLEAMYHTQQGFEAIIGGRYLDFRQNQVYVLTGALNKYFKSYWFSARAFVTPDNSVISASYLLEARRYFQRQEDFIGLKAGYGYTPDFRSFQTSDGLSTTQVFLLDAQEAQLSGQKGIGYRLILSARLGIVRQEVAIEAGQYIWISTAVGGLAYRL